MVAIFLVFLIPPCSIKRFYDTIFAIEVIFLINRMYSRVVQSTLYLASNFFIKTPEPKLIEGVGSLNQVPSLLIEHKITSVLLITDQFVEKLEPVKELICLLQSKPLSFTIFNRVMPNPTIEVIEQAKQIYLEHHCDAAIAIGGGSVIDLAKAMLALVVNPKKSIPDLKGILKVKKRLPFLIAVPTTAGTGSEATLAAVVTNPKTLEKYAINDPHLVPDYAILDASLLKGLPKQLSATTGMDALTHAVEAYIGKANTKKTIKASEEAIRIIYKHLGPSVFEPNNLESKAKMQKAAYLAGYAFTRAYVGNIHAIAHTLGGFYNVPHGLANAVIMPVVLRKYGKAVHKPLARLADLAHVCGPRDSVEVKAEKMIASIEEMNLAFGLPRWFDVIQPNDIPTMAKRAYQEANPLYPVPVFFSTQDFETIYHQISRKLEYIQE